MSTALAARAARHMLVLSIIAGLHLGAFALVSAGLIPDLALVRIAAPPFTFRQPPTPVPVVRPEEFRAEDYDAAAEQEPEIVIPTFDEGKAVAMAEAGWRAGGGSAPGSAQAIIQAPGVRTRDGRVHALINGCYPAASRRLSEEGKVVALVVIGADGRPVTWSVEQGSGFPRLDAAADCVLRRLEFVAGRRDGRAVESTARLPIAFRLD